MQELFTQKIATEQRVAREELAILKLTQALQQEAAIHARMGELDQEMEAGKQRLLQTSRALTKASNLVKEVQAEHDALAKEDKALDRGFKQRKELAGCEPYLDALLRVYRRRPKGYGLDVELPALDMAQDCPDGMEEAKWKQFVVLHKQKVALERQVQAKSAELLAAKAFFASRQEEDVAATAAVDRCIEERAALHKELDQLALNLEVLVTVRQGQVELTHADDFDPVYSDAVLLHRSTVDDLNAITRQLAEVCTSTRPPVSAPCRLNCAWCGCVSVSVCVAAPR